MKRALITGITGQDGSYLAELLLQKGYSVYGVVRLSRTYGFENIKGILDRITLLDADLLEHTSLTALLEDVEPDEVYNLGSLSYVPTSWKMPVLMAEINAVGVGRILEAIRCVNPKIRFYQASSSEMFGAVKEVPQNEDTPFNPVNPYAVAKVYGHHITRIYREAYGLNACSGILFNHESPRRGLQFVTRKVTRGVAQIKLGQAKEICLGNLEAKRDWGYSPDYVEAIWMMLQQRKPDDYVIATGKTRSVEELLDCAFSYIRRPWREHVRIDPKMKRPVDVNLLVGDASKAKQHLNWSPKKTFQEMIWEMVEADIRDLTDNRQGMSPISTAG
ncbi:MAG: GDP-mannose 4,6-dehydratase [Pseudomonadota bacterium]